MSRLLMRATVGVVSLLAVAVAPASAADSAQHRSIVAHDACDAATFNAAIGPGTCMRAGGVPFNLFLDQVQRTHQAPAWRFTPDAVSASTTEPIDVRNDGGEVHTFTEVEHFGGGVVPLLNQLSGNPVEAPECGMPPNDDNHTLAPGQSFSFTEGDTGTHLYQCCIHPWMRVMLTINESRQGVTATR